MLTHHHLKEALRFAKNSLFNQPKIFKGDADKICRQIVKQCWNGTFFQTSLGNYPEFYVRDFSICCEALIKLGYKDEVLKTLVYALEIFKKHGKITTTITPDNVPIDCFYPTPESAAFITNDLVLLQNKAIIEQYADFIEQQAQSIYDNDFDKASGLLRKDKLFSAMKDNAVRQSACYDNCMLAMLSNNLNKLRLANPFKEYDFKKLIKDNFWQDGFIDDLSGLNIYSGDANTFPYWCNIFDDRTMFKKSLAKIQKLYLDKPFPLKYTAVRIKSQEMAPMKYFIPNWQGSAIWCNLGMCYLDVVGKFDKILLKQYLKKYKKLIEKHHNFMEVFTKEGTPYRKLFYKSDSGMLWASKYLHFQPKA